MNMKFGIVVTNYNNSDYTAGLIKSVRNGAQSKIDIVVVDNNSIAIEREKLRKMQDIFDNVHCIFNAENKGYFAGLNDGIKYLLIKNGSYDAIMIGNNDIEVPESFFDDLESACEILQRYPVVCPNIITFDGVHQNPHVVSPISNIRMWIWKLYFSNFLISRIIDNLAVATRAFSARKDAKGHATAGVIFEGYGACYLLTPRFFEKFDALWAPTFLMGEEFFLAKQIQQSGANLYYEPRIVVRHHDHGAVAKLPSRQFWEISKASHRVYLDYADKYGHHGAPIFQNGDASSQ
jgi:GT2 family glycosyltransferase